MSGPHQTPHSARGEETETTGGTKGDMASRSRTAAIQDTHLLIKHKQKVNSLQMAHESGALWGAMGYIQQKQFYQGLCNLSSPGPACYFCG